MEDVDSIAGNIYLGRVENIIPGLDGAFVNIGGSRNAFLRFKDLSSRYMKEILRKEALEKGDKILVQVKKDSTKIKGPQVTTRISLAGRYIVYFPMNFAKGISKRIVDRLERDRLKAISKRLRNKGEGLIIRTAAEGVSEELISEELESLRREWRDLLKRFRRSRKPKVLREEPSLEERILRERFDRMVERVVTNDLEIADIVRKHAEVYGKFVELEYVEGDVFEKMGIYDLMNELTRRTVPLESGGFIVIDTTEALTVIDVNSAGFTDSKTHRELILKTNLEAAREIARQIRLRNIGGMVIIDFITMEWEEDRKKVIEELKRELIKDRAHTEVLGFTRLGLLEMTRKRTTKPLESIILSRCPVCHGTGRIISPTVNFNRIVEEMKKVESKKVHLRVHPVMSGYFNSENMKKLKKQVKKDIEVEYTWCDPNSFDMKFKR